MYLEKEEVSLYYEVHGEGEPLLLIHGAIVDGDLYKNTAQILAKKYQVIVFDRRGNSRSVCKCEQSFSLDTQIEDIRDLLDELNIMQTYIVGASAGAVIGQYFMQTYPERVKHLIMYEPAMTSLMFENPEVAKFGNMMKDLIDRGRYNTALLRFSEHIASYDTRGPKKDLEMAIREMRNHENVMVNEFPELAAYQPDLDCMKKLADRFTLALGEKSDNTLYTQVPKYLAELLGKEVIYYPGYHNLPYDLPKEFAICVHGTLSLGVI